MKATVILAHPYPGSFNHAIYRTIRTTLAELHIETHAHDLYAEGFDPVLSATELGTDRSDDPQVNACAAELMESDLLFFIHPNWWGQPPAILKGYIDRVIRPPYAYDFPEEDNGGGLPIGKLAGKHGVVFNTSNTEGNREEDYFGDPLENIWKRCVFGFCGIEDYHRKMFRIVADSTPDERREWLEEVSRDVRQAVRDSMAVSFRKCEARNMPFLMNMLYEAVFWRKGPTTPSREEGLALPEVQRAMAGFGSRDGDLAVIAFTDGQTPVGAAWWRYWNEEDDVRGFVAGNVPVIGIAVAEDFRHRGVGKGLMDWLIDYAAKHAIPEISLCVSKDNPGLELYRKTGFIEHEDLDHSFNMIRKVF